MFLFESFFFVASMFSALLFSCAASFFDLKRGGIIPNRLVLTGLATALVLAFFTGLLAQVAVSLFFSFAFGFFLFLLGAWRGGDGKVFTVLSGFASLLAPQDFFAFLKVFLFSAVFLLAFLLVRGGRLDLGKTALAGFFCLGVKEFKRRRRIIFSRSHKVAFAPFLACGFAAFVLFLMM